MTERSDAPLADEPQPGAVPNDMPTGMPAGAEDDVESTPLGTPESDPEGEGETDRGEEAMPGIPHEGEPPASA